MNKHCARAQVQRKKSPPRLQNLRANPTRLLKPKLPKRRTVMLLLQNRLLRPELRDRKRSLLKGPLTPKKFRRKKKALLLPTAKLATPCVSGVTNVRKTLAKAPKLRAPRSLQTTVLRAKVRTRKQNAMKSQVTHQALL